MRSLSGEYRRCTPDGSLTEAENHLGKAPELFKRTEPGRLCPLTVIANLVSWALTPDKWAPEARAPSFTRTINRAEMANSFFALERCICQLFGEKERRLPSDDTF